MFMLVTLLMFLLTLFFVLYFLVDMIARFLRGPQLTLHGLTCLREELKEKEPCVLLWNGSFITAINVRTGKLMLVLF
ncbi:hypothetical protein U9M48_029358 [Paspalum notatum var. saurae]|uniref:MINDY deubiquitinase domain-containing protein n=1 Tax=Paspalum notatum var. saurae TaxID=547442 RepID=A0AAQ3X284_PASNO